MSGYVVQSFRVGKHVRSAEYFRAEVSNLANRFVKGRGYDVWSFSCSEAEVRCLVIQLFRGKGKMSGHSVV